MRRRFKMASGSNRMLLFVVLLSLSIFILGQEDDGEMEEVSVDKSTCEWRGARFGVSARCRPDEVAVGGCGSGSQGDCGGDEGNGEIWQELFCCSLEDFRRTDCNTNKGFPGKRLSCPIARRSDEYLVNAACGSATFFDCNFFTHSIDCCRGMLGTSWLGSSGVCYWKYGDSGERVECSNNNEAVFGRCGSGGNADCGAPSQFHGIECCTLAAFDKSINDRGSDGMGNGGDGGFLDGILSLFGR